ncbi:hypothetical protein HYS47_00420 [Candidatus Woesearchaeota archaeon]|nr:hypothetical protein [Candidatus Woesearchaeota archaeon]
MKTKLTIAVTIFTIALVVVSGLAGCSSRRIFQPPSPVSFSPPAQSTSSFCDALIREYGYQLMLTQELIIQNRQIQNRDIDPPESADDLLGHAVRSANSLEDVIEWLKQQDCIATVRPMTDFLPWADIVKTASPTNLHITFVKGFPMDARAIAIDIDEQFGRLRYNGFSLLVP